MLKILHYLRFKHDATDMTCLDKTSTSNRLIKASLKTPQQNTINSKTTNDFKVRESTAAKHYRTFTVATHAANTLKLKHQNRTVATW